LISCIMFLQNDGRLKRGHSFRNIQYIFICLGTLSYLFFEDSFTCISFFFVFVLIFLYYRIWHYNSVVMIWIFVNLVNLVNLVCLRHKFHENHILACCTDIWISGQKNCHNMNKIANISIHDIPPYCFIGDRKIKI
jgi:hypothetical protein